jgi:hypothetical protein
MRRPTFAFVALVLCLTASACISATSPDGGRTPRGEWMPDGTWCSGYIQPNGQCSED